MWLEQLVIVSPADALSCGVVWVWLVEGYPNRPIGGPRSNITPVQVIAVLDDLRYPSWVLVRGMVSVSPRLSNDPPPIGWIVGVVAWRSLLILFTSSARKIASNASRRALRVPSGVSALQQLAGSQVASR